MALPLAIQTALSEIRLRVSDPDGDQYSDAEIVTAADYALESIWTDVRLSNKDHDLKSVDLPVSGFAVDGIEYTVDLDEMVRVIRKVELPSTGNGRPVPVEEADLEAKDAPRSTLGGRSPVWYQPEQGVLAIVGSLGSFQTVRVWYLRGWPPLHYGVAQVNGAPTTTTMVLSAAPVGRIARRSSVLVGHRIEFTAGPNLDAIVRVTAYDPVANMVTFTPAVTAAPSASDSYSLVVPLTPEHNDFFIESTVTKLLERSGNAQYMASRAPNYNRLYDRFLADVQHRNQDKPLSVFSSRR